MVQLAFETMLCFAASYVSSLTPRQMVTSGFFAGALIRTRFAPPLVICSSALSRLVKKPVDSRTTSTPKSFQGKLAGIRSFKILILWPRTMMFCVVVTDLAVEFAVDRIPFQQVCESEGVGQIVDRADAFDVALCIARRTLRPMRPKPLMP